MVALDLRPRLWAARAVSSHWSPSILWSQITRRTRSLKISAPPAGSHADVGGIDMAVYVEIGNVAMHPLAHLICQPTHCQNISRTIESYRILKAKPLAGKNLFGNRQKARVICLKPMLYAG